MVTGPAIDRWRPLRGRLLAVATTAELVLLAGALAIATTSTEPFAATPQSLIVVVAAIALGIQNTSARELAVPDGTTTVLTMTLTGFAADLRNRDGRVLLRRLLAVGAMCLGALAGAVLVLQVSAALAMALAVVLVASVCAGTWLLGQRPAAWQTRTTPR